MNINIKTTQATLLKFILRVRRYAVFIFIVVLLLLYSWLVFRINTLNNTGPSDDAVTQKLQTVRRPKIDQTDIDKLQQLQDNSVQVKTLFQQARDNPFHE